jgi:anaerobic magnesium-protoporphyrin IX monomethyl ester cyclase
MIDVLFITPGNNQNIYQELASRYSAIEPPTWALLLAESCRSRGFTVGLCDINAENLSNNDVLQRVRDSSPRLVCFVVYGQNVNAGSVNMSGAVQVANFLRDNEPSSTISLIGSHVQALPTQTLKKELCFNFGFTNEGVYALWNVLSLDKINEHNLLSIRGLVTRHEGKVVITKPEKVVPNERMDLDLPGYAWDLLPYKEKPLDLYRSPMWHVEYDESKRSPYAAIQTSLGCRFGCDFCMINMINRDDQEEVGVAGSYSQMRHWTTGFIINEFDKLAKLGVFTIKITDELFLFHKKYYEPLCQQLSERPYSKKLTMWAYSRIDTVRNSELLKLVRSAGIKWLALGIESGDKKIRLEVSKGKFQDVDIQQVVEQIHKADINVMANYIFGLPGDTKESMQRTLDLSKELCTLGWNAYAAMALPGSKLYRDALIKGIELPQNYEEFSFYGKNTKNLPTESCTAKEIISFRDQAFRDYHSDEGFLKLVEEKFGIQRVNAIKDMLQIKLVRN